MTNRENLQYTSLIRAMYIMGRDDVADRILKGDDAEIEKVLEDLKKEHQKK